MTAFAKEPWNFGDAMLLHAKTVRRIQKGHKSSHLFIEYIDGAVSGFPRAFCRLVVAWHPKQWTDTDETAPLCNHCGRAFHARSKEWRKQP